MGHAAVDNTSDLAFEQLFSRDEEGRPLFVALAQASYDISTRGLRRTEPQPAIVVAGEPWGPTDPAAGSLDPPPQTDGVVSYRLEPQFAFAKLGTDVVLVGHAHARGSASEVNVSLSVGPVAKSLIARGDRVWVKSAGTITPTRAQPFQRIPLRWERAFGGWDRRDPASPLPFWPNPLGVGYQPEGSPFVEGSRLPNLEDPRQPLERWGQVVAPAGFGFTMPNWKPRLGLAGTYDGAWMSERMPLLPRDFDRRFFSAAAPGLVAPGYLRGDEPVVIAGATPFGQIGFSLPGVRPPKIRAQLLHNPDVLIDTQLDTVIIDTDIDRLLLLFRGYAKLRDSPHEVKTVVIRA